MRSYEDAIRVFEEFRREFEEFLPSADDPQCCKEVALEMLDCLDTVLRAGNAEDQK